MDAIILLNDNYAAQGLFKGYIGTVMANFIEKYGFVVADFSNPIESGYIQPVIEIKKKINLFSRKHIINKRLSRHKQTIKQNTSNYQPHNNPRNHLPFLRFRFFALCLIYNIVSPAHNLISTQNEILNEHHIDIQTP